MATTAFRPTTNLLPEVIKNLMIINGLVFLAQMILEAGGSGVFSTIDLWFALWPIGGPEAVQFSDGVVQFGTFQPWQVVTTAFLHGGFTHILFNMYALFLFGSAVERTLGTKRFAILYGAAVLGASLIQLAVISAPYLTSLPDPPFPIPTVGASGGVMGVVAACAVLFPRSEIYIIPFPFPIQMRWMALGYVALDLFGGFGARDTGIAHFAHLGGFAAGALAILYWRGKLPVRPRARLT